LIFCFAPIKCFSLRVENRSNVSLSASLLLVRKNLPSHIVVGSQWDGN